MNHFLRAILLLSACGAAHGFQAVAPSSPRTIASPSSTRLHGTGDGGQRREDEAMYYGTPPTPKQATKTVAPVARKVRQGPAWQRVTQAKEVVEPKKAVPKKAAPKKAAPKKAAPKKAAPKKAAPKAGGFKLGGLGKKTAAPEKPAKKSGGFKLGGLGKKKAAAPEVTSEAPKKKGFSFGKL